MYTYIYGVVTNQIIEIIVYTQPFRKRLQWVQVGKSSLHAAKINFNKNLDSFKIKPILVKNDFYPVQN